ncbi:hypothetical protein Dimus_017589, partial [Dionaea muscipula]
MVKYNAYFGNVSKVNMLVFVALVLDPEGKMIILSVVWIPHLKQELLKICMIARRDYYKTCMSVIDPLKLNHHKFHLHHKHHIKLPSRTSKVVGNKKLWDVLGDENEFDAISTLASIARDIFAIPDFYELLESAFDLGGRVITDRRSSLLLRSLKHLYALR